MGPENQQMGGGWATPGSQTGDIILTPSAPADDGKKKRIIVFAAVIVAAVICVVATILIPNQYKGGGSSSSKREFESYAGYLLKGVDDEAKDAEEVKLDVTELSNPDVQFKFEEIAMRVPENASEYWNKLNGKYEKLLGTTKSDEVKDLLVKQNVMLKVYRVITPLSYAGMIDSESEKNKAAELLASVEEYNDKDDEMYEYYVAMNGYVKAAAKEYEIYENNDCVVAGEVDYECVENIPESAFEGLISAGNYQSVMRAESNILDSRIRENTTTLFNLFGVGK